VDITERKRTEEQQALLVRELHHRVKNTLATVQAIMGSTARSARTIEDFKNALIGRIGSLAKTYVLLTDEGNTTTFADILHSELDAFDDGSGDRIRFSGPRIDVPSRLAMSRSAWRSTNSPPMPRSTARFRSSAAKWTSPGL
jgi:two-component sensor histidine kinase